MIQVWLPGSGNEDITSMYKMSVVENGEALAIHNTTLYMHTACIQSLLIDWDKVGYVIPISLQRWVWCWTPESITSTFWELGWQTPVSTPSLHGAGVVLMQSFQIWFHAAVNIGIQIKHHYCLSYFLWLFLLLCASLPTFDILLFLVLLLFTALSLLLFQSMGTWANESSLISQSYFYNICIH